MTTASLEEWRTRGAFMRHREHRVFTFADENPNASTRATLLCIHGFPSASWDYARIWPSLRERFGTLLTLDMMGFGFSAKPNGYRYSIADQANVFEAFLRSRKIERCHVLAHDYGDTVAQELLARHEARLASGDQSLAIASVCLLNGGIFPETHHARLVQKALASPLGPLVARFTRRRQFGRGFAAVFGPQTKPTERELDDYWRLIEENNGRAAMVGLIGYIAERRLHRERWVGVLTKTTVPLKLVDGLADPVSGADMVARYRELVPNADVTTLDGIGHYPQLEAPEAVLRAFFAFHDRLAAPG